MPPKLEAQVIQMTPAIFRVLDDRHYTLPADDDELSTYLASNAQLFYDACAANLHVANPKQLWRAIDLFFKTWADFSIPFVSKLNHREPNKGECIKGFVALWLERRRFFSSTDTRDKAEQAAAEAGATAGVVELDLSNVWTGEYGPNPDDPLEYDGQLPQVAPPVEHGEDADVDELAKLAELASRVDEQGDQEQQDLEELENNISQRPIGSFKAPNTNPFTPPSLAFPLPTDSPSLFALLLERFEAYAKWWDIEEASDSTRAERNKRYEACLRDLVSRCDAEPRDLAILLLMPFVPRPMDLFSTSAFNQPDYLELTHHNYLKGCTTTPARLAGAQKSPNRLTQTWAMKAHKLIKLSPSKDVEQALAMFGLEVDDSRSETIQLVHGGQTRAGPGRHFGQVTEIMNPKFTRYYVTTARDSLSWSDALSRDQPGMVRWDRRYLALAEHGLLVRGFGDPSRGGALVGEALDQNRDDLEVLSASLGGRAGSNVKKPGMDVRSSMPAMSTMFSARELVILDAACAEVRTNPPKYIVVLDAQPPVSGEYGTHWQAAKMGVIVNVLDSIFGDSVELCFVEGVAAALPLLDGPSASSSSSSSRPRLVVIAENLRPDNKVRGVPYSFTAKVCGPHLKDEIIAHLPAGPAVVLSIAGDSPRILCDLARSSAHGVSTGKTFLLNFTSGKTSVILDPHAATPLVFSKPLAMLGIFRLMSSHAPVYAATTPAVLYALSLAHRIETVAASTVFPGPETLLAACVEVQQELSRVPLAAIVDHHYALLAMPARHNSGGKRVTEDMGKPHVPRPTERRDIITAAHAEGYEISWEDYETIELLSPLGYPTTGCGLLEAIALSRTTSIGPTILTSLGQSFAVIAHASHLAQAEEEGRDVPGYLRPAPVAIAAVEEGRLKVRLVATALHLPRHLAVTRMNVRYWDPPVTKEIFAGLSPIIGSPNSRHGRLLLMFDPIALKFRLQMPETGLRSEPFDIALAAAELIVPGWRPGEQPVLVGRLLTGHQHVCLWRCLVTAASEQRPKKVAATVQVLVDRAFELAIETKEIPGLNFYKFRNWADKLLKTAFSKGS